MLTLDHLAIATETLAEGAALVEAALGVPLEPGGRHEHMGTHNRLLSLGPGEYLEVIAIDLDGTAPAQPRWFNLDDFSGATRTTNWVCRCPDLQDALTLAPRGAGRPWDLARGDLRWRMAVPEDGKLPYAGLFPALIEWQGEAHPAKILPDRGVRLIGLTLHAPDADDLREALGPMLRDRRIALEPGDTPRLEAQFQTPTGVVVL